MAQPSNDQMVTPPITSQEGPCWAEAGGSCLAAQVDEPGRERPQSVAVSRARPGRDLGTRLGSSCWRGGRRPGGHESDRLPTVWSSFRQVRPVTVEVGIFDWRH